ncbi:MAG: VirB4 family type IV secretion system protein [Candidatus Dormibacteria bacterium]
MRRRAGRVPEEAVGWLGLDGLDLRAADAATEGAVAEAARRLFAAVEGRLCLLATRRRVMPGPVAIASPPEPVRRRLDGAMVRHRQARLEEVGAYRTRAYVGIAAPPGMLAHRIEVVAAGLSAVGVAAVPCAAPPHIDVTAGHEAWDGIAGSPGFVSALELARLPGAPVRLGWMAPLLSAPVECDLSLWFDAVPQAVAHRVLERRMRGLVATRLLDEERGRIGDARIEAGVDAAAALRERLARNEVRALRLAIVAVVRAPDRAVARRDSAALLAAAAATGLRLRHAHLAHAAVARTVTQAGAPRTARLVDSAAAATCLPLTETWCDDPRGYRLGAGLRTNLPVAVDVFDTAHHANANVAVIAASGQGKSFTLGLFLLEAVARGVGAVVIDPEGEYEPLVRSCGGEVVRLGAARGGAINVFDAAATPGTPGTPGTPATPDAGAGAGLAVDLVTVLAGGVLTEVERSRVDAAMRAVVSRAAARGETALLSDALEELRDTVPRAAAVLARACAPPFDRLFASPSDVTIDAPLVAISLCELPHDLVAAATLLVASWLWARVQRGGSGHIVIDEVGSLCAHPPLRTLLVQLARRCRKQGASLVVATQNIDDLLRTDDGAVVVTNCATALLGGHRSAEVARLVQAFGLTEPQRRFLEHAGRGEFLLLAGARRLEVRVEAPPLHADLLQPRRWGRNPLRGLPDPPQ